MTNKQLKVIFDHPVFQENWKPEIRDIAIDEDNDKLTVVKAYSEVITTYEKDLVFKSKVTYIPSVEQLQEMSGLDWWEFDTECSSEACGYYDKIDDSILTWCRVTWKDKRYRKRVYKEVPKLLAATMVVMNQRGFKWNGKEWVK